MLFATAASRRMTDAGNPTAPRPFSVKQTAGNNVILARIKAGFCAPLFKKASEILNREGAEAAVEHVVKAAYAPEFRKKAGHYLLTGSSAPQTTKKPRKVRAGRRM